MARKNKIQGLVVLKAVFTADGEIRQIRVIRGLPYGLTGQAILAAEKIRFEPMQRNGESITVRGDLEYVFHLY